MVDSRVDGATQKELSSFLEQEQAKARLQTSIHTFTDMCFDKCVPKAPDSRFSRSEESCLVNCVDRFLDTSLFVVSRLQERQAEATPPPTF